MIKLGARVQDIVSGFKGVVTARTEFLNGCVRCCVAPEKLDKGAVSDGYWFDVQQLKVLTEDTPAAKIVQDNTGGPRPDARRRCDASRPRDTGRR